MAKSWTMKEQKLCCAAYSEGGIRQARLAVNRSDSAITTMIRDSGASSQVNTGQQKRAYYAEDIVQIFEMVASGIKHSIIAEYYNTTRVAIKFTIYNARKNGFDAYPVRNK